MREPRVYAPGDRPDVEVLVDGDWSVGELRMWKPVDPESWVAQVQWRPPGTNTRRIDTFDQADVRPAEETHLVSRSPTDPGQPA